MMRKHQLRSPAWSNSTGSAAWWTLGKSLKMPNETHISWQQNRSAPVILSIHCWCNCQDCLGPYLHGCADNIQQSCMHFERENSKREAIWNKCMRYIYDHLCWSTGVQEDSGRKQLTAVQLLTSHSPCPTWSSLCESWGVNLAVLAMMCSPAKHAFSSPQNFVWHYCLEKTWNKWFFLRSSRTAKTKESVQPLPSTDPSWEIGLLTALRAHGHTSRGRSTGTQAHGHTSNPRAHGHPGTRAHAQSTGTRAPRQDR